MSVGAKASGRRSRRSWLLS